MEIKRSKVMGIISLASGSSCWRGLNYYKEKRVIELNKINEIQKNKNGISWYLSFKEAPENCIDENCNMLNE